MKARSQAEIAIGANTQRRPPGGALGTSVLAAVQRVGSWNLVLFVGALALYLAVGAIVNLRLSATGDEPSYLLLGDALIRHHTVDLALTAQDHLPLPIAWAHVTDYLGNGKLLVYYLPGYSLLIGPFYELGGRMAVYALQGVIAAGAVVMLFQEGRRMYASRVAGLFAALAFLVALPVLLYVGQAYPSTMASAAAFAGFLLVTRRLPNATATRQLLVATGIGGISALLPWLHFKYAPEALALAFLALAQLRPLLRRPLSEHRWSWLAALVICCLTTSSFLTIALYCHANFGTWTPPFASGTHSVISFADPSLPRLLTLFADMFVSQQSGLLTWAPLYVLVIPGAVLLWRRARTEAMALLLYAGGLWAGFLPALFSSDIAQAYALPARFAVESAPFFALSAAGVCAASLPTLLPALAALRSRLRRARGSVTATTIGIPQAGGARARGPAPVALAALAISCLVLLLATAEFSLVGLRNPELLYPSSAGNRLLAKYPHALPGWWFAVLPDPLHLVTYSGRLSLAPGEPAAAGPTSTAPTVFAATAEIPVGAYKMTLTLNCVSSSATTPADATHQIQVVVERFAGALHTPLAGTRLAAAECMNNTAQVTLPFTSLGYQPTIFRVVADPDVAITQAQAEYAPSRG